MKWERTRLPMEAWELSVAGGNSFVAHGISRSKMCLHGMISLGFKMFLSCSCLQIDGISFIVIWELYLQEALQNYCNGSGPLHANMWDGSYMSVSGRCWGRDTNAAKLSQLHLAAAHLYFSLSLQERYAAALHGITHSLLFIRCLEGQNNFSMTMLIIAMLQILNKPL